MEKYIFTWEGEHYITDSISDRNIEDFEEGFLTIIRVSDLKQLKSVYEWVTVPKWSD